MTTTTDLDAYVLPAASPAAFLADSERRDPLAPLRGVLLGILLGGALWIDAFLLVRALL
jgi:hypothetical protein